MTFADILEGTIDFEGQRLAEQLTHYLLSVTGILSFIIGYSVQSIQTTLIVFAAGLVITALVIIPPWPVYNKHPQPWLQDKSKEEKTD